MEDVTKREGWQQLEILIARVKTLAAPAEVNAAQTDEGVARLRSDSEAVRRLHAVLDMLEEPVMQKARDSGAFVLSESTSGPYNSGLQTRQTNPHLNTYAAGPSVYQQQNVNSPSRFSEASEQLFDRQGTLFTSWAGPSQQQTWPQARVQLADQFMRANLYSSHPNPSQGDVPGLELASYGQRAPSQAEIERIEEQTLYESFKVRSKPKRFFRPGRVVMILWTEPWGGGDDRQSLFSNISFLGNHGERVCSKIRRFIIVSQYERHSLAIPIMSYRGRGVSGQGVNKADHGVVYTGPTPPIVGGDECPIRGEVGMVPIAIKIVPDEVTETLAPMSRIHYGKVSTIEHNVKVKSLGMVSDSSMAHLMQQHRHVLSRPTPNGFGM